MTPKQMHELLNLKMLGIDTDLTLENKTMFLNLAVDWATLRLERHYLHELDTLATSKTLDSTSGYFDLSTLTAAPVFIPERGLYGVKLTGKHFATKKSFQEYRTLVNKDLYTPSAYDPIYYLLGTKVYVLPYSGETIDLYYLTTPATIVYDPITSSNDVTCNLSSDTHQMIVEYAAGLIFGALSNREQSYRKRADDCYETAYGMLDTLNSAAPPTESVEYNHSIDIDNSRPDPFIQTIDLSDLSI